ncbi:MAG: 16S rRNA (guanine(966)-N(2))-methyltransferase RsmD [Deltaproteobacteria bacterium]|nr:16S rRNA (guanine(966)-N(2))-methyltransferase RsmD [Deltaproteobacteria bacterium]MBW2136418.1 16S rRNA (guanine(966)-N(2))-methyltransferase RsmD [Deltaproteobacteria bacterium]
MRITGGDAKGRTLAPVKGFRVRPTSDRVREAIFNLIGQEVRGKVLDLFAGSGVLGLEALSRGAEKAVFVDLSNQAVRLIKRNLQLCGYEKKGLAYRGDLSKGFSLRAPWAGGKYDLVFLDPPYGKGFIPSTLEVLVRGGVLAGSAVVVAESGKGEVLPPFQGPLRMVDSRTYGDTRISIYEYEV